MNKLLRPISHAGCEDEVKLPFPFPIARVLAGVSKEIHVTMTVGVNGGEVTHLLQPAWLTVLGRNSRQAMTVENQSRQPARASGR